MPFGSPLPFSQHAPQGCLTANCFLASPPCLDGKSSRPYQPAIVFRSGLAFQAIPFWHIQPAIAVRICRCTFANTRNRFDLAWSAQPAIAFWQRPCLLGNARSGIPNPRSPLGYAVAFQSMRSQGCRFGRGRLASPICPSGPTTIGTTNPRSLFGRAFVFQENPALADPTRDRLLIRPCPFDNTLKRDAGLALVF